MRDLHRLGRGPEVQRDLAAVQALADGKPNLDVKALKGRSPYLRLRVGDFRVLFRPLPALEQADERFWVERVVHRSMLEQAVEKL